MRNIVDLPGQDVLHDHRRAPRRARREERQGGLGNADRRSDEGQLRRNRRIDRRSTARSCRGSSGATATGQRRCYISAYDANTGKQLWKFHTIARGERARRRHLGQARRQLAHRRRNLDHRQLRSGAEPHLLGHRAGEALGAGEPRHSASSTPASTQASTLALNPDDGKLAWHYQHIPGEVARSGRGLRARARRHRRSKVRLHDRQGRHPVEARSEDRQAYVGAQGNDLSERLRSDRCADRQAGLPRRHHRRQR